MTELSVIIPARNEMFLKRTVDDVLAKSEANTEVIVISDGDWPLEPLDDDPRVLLIRTGKPVGQREAINIAARISTAKFIMKLDAHCIVDQGFDRKLMEDCEYTWTVVPAMYNLHAFDWVCEKCGNKWYQSPTPKFCCKDKNGKVQNEKCDNTTRFKRKMVWKPRLNKRSEFMRFDRDLHFQYWGSFKDRPEAQGDIADTMSLVGACFFMHRQRYWDLDGSDEEHGSWGQQGTEIACKTWLSGGRLVVNKKTWFSHLFRTQGGDFGFPYQHKPGAIDNARRHSRKLWMENKWSKAIHPLSWLIEKFKPVPGWHDNGKPEKKLTKGVVYYTDNQLSDGIANACRKQILKGIKEKHIVSVALNRPIDFGAEGKRIVLQEQRGYLTMAKQILAGLRASDADVVFFCEHDVLYHPSHFDFLPPRKDCYYYNTNVWRVRIIDSHALYTENLQQLSGLVAYRDTLVTHYKKRIELLQEFVNVHSHAEGTPRYAGLIEEYNRYVRRMGFEPGTHNRPDRVDDLKAESYQSTFPNLDLRHDGNLTPSRWEKSQFRNQRYTQGWKECEAWEIPGWQDALVEISKETR